MPRGPKRTKEEILKELNAKREFYAAKIEKYTEQINEINNEVKRIQDEISINKALALTAAIESSGHTVDEFIKKLDSTDDSGQSDDISVQIKTTGDTNPDQIANQSA